MSMERETGTIKMYNAERGYGFIERRMGEDVFLSRAAVERAGLGIPQPGEVVTFSMRRTERGFQAEQVQRVGAVPQLQERAVGQFSPARDYMAPAAQIDGDYLREGYFELRDEQASIRPELLDGLAIGVAHALGQSGMKSAQLRRFLCRARGIDSRFAHERNQHILQADVYTFKRDVAYQVGRKMLPESFQQFINRNIEVSDGNPENFRRGFIPHFESVVAYFAYYFREQ